MSPRKTGRRASGASGGPSLSPAHSPRAGRRRRGAAAPAFGTPSAPLLVLALLAAGLPIFASGKFADQTAMPRLAGTAWLTGAALVALCWTRGWAGVPWRAVRWPLVALGAFLAVEVVATVLGVDPVRGLLGETTRYQGLLPMLMYGALMLAAIAATARGDSPRALLWGFFAGGVLSAAYGLIQKAGLDWVTWVGLPAGRIGAAFAQPDVLAIELVVAAAASTGLWQDADAQTRRTLGAGVAVMVAALLFTESRGGAVGAVVAALVLLAFYARRLPPWRSLWPLAPAAVAVAALVLVLPAGRHALRRIGSSGNLGESSISAHIGVWQTSLKMARDRPIIGAGPDAFPVIFGEYRAADQREYGTSNVRPESTHNFLLDQLVDAGAAGVLAWAALVGACLWLALRRLASLDAARRAVVAGIIAAIAGYYAAAFFSFNQSMTGWMPWLLIGVLVGVAVAGEDAGPARADAVWRRAAVPLAAALGGIVLIVLGVLAAAADWQSARAGNTATDGNLPAAADMARIASRLDPLNPQYLVQLGFLQGAIAGGSSGPAARASWRDALDTYHRLNTRFAPSASSLAREAEARANVSFSTDADRQAVFDLLERAVRLDPNSAEVRQGVAAFYTQVGEPERAAPHLAWMREHGVQPLPPQQ